MNNFLLLAAFKSQKHEWTNTRLGSLHTYNHTKTVVKKKLFVLGITKTWENVVCKKKRCSDKCHAYLNEMVWYKETNNYGILKYFGI